MLCLLACLPSRLGPPHQLRRPLVARHDAAGKRLGMARQALRQLDLGLNLVAVLVAQGTGVFWLTVPMILFAAVVLTVVWVLLALFGIAVFERERILTRLR